MASAQANPQSSTRVHEGKLALVTGSARSIGAAIVRNLASKGCNIIVNHATESSDKAAADLCDELQTTHGVKAIWVRADVSNKEGCEKIVETAKANFTNPQTGKLQLDILIHNAALCFVGALEDVTESDFYKTYSVNVLGPILLTQAFVPYLPTDRSGRIVMMSSINSKTGTQGTTLYAGSKGALEAITRVFSRELAERATVNSINPGPVMTDMYMSAPDEIKQTLARWNPVTPLVPVRPTDTPEVQELGEKFGGRAAYDWEIAGIISMICSPESGWCTGSLISANGGLAFSL